MRFVHHDEIESFFLHAERASGLVSSWATLVGIALGGDGGSRDPEARITDRRFSLGPAGRTEVSRARQVRATLMQLSETHQKVLFAAHGGLSWSQYLDAVFGKGMGAKVTAKLGAAIGVALLTDAVAHGFARDRARGAQKSTAPPALPWKARPPIWENEGGWLVHVCLAEPQRLLVVRQEADALLASAEAAYAAARGPMAAERARPTARRARRPAWDPFAVPGRAS